MAKLNGRKQKAIEGLAATLTECFEAATEAGTKHVDARLDKQDDTLRLFWKQLGGDENQHLPIDDWSSCG